MNTVDGTLGAELGAWESGTRYLQWFANIHTYLGARCGGARGLKSLRLLWR